MAAACEARGMRRLLAIAALAAGALAFTAGAAPAASPSAAACRQVSLSWGSKCIAAGQFCKISGDAEYHGYGFHCHTGRLSTSSAGGNATGAGCQAGYSPCLPRVADLNCADIPASKRPVRVTGSDPYGLDGNHDGWGCTS
jgi:hypothetical protein